MGRNIDSRGPYILMDVTAPFDRPLMRYEWNGHLPPNGRSWRFSAERARMLEEEGRISYSPSGRPRLKRYLSEIESPTEPQGEAAPPLQLEFIIRTAMKAVAARIARNPACLPHVEWRDLERALREVFEQLGFFTELTRSGKDGGFDLRLEYNGIQGRKTFLVEVKHWAASRKRVGSRVLSALVDIVARAWGETTGVLLSSSGFTAGVINGRTQVEQHSVRIGDQNKIVSLCHNYVQSTEGLWSPTNELPEMLLEGTW